MAGVPDFLKTDLLGRRERERERDLRGGPNHPMR